MDLQLSTPPKGGTRAQPPRPAPHWPPRGGGRRL